MWKERKYQRRAEFIKKLAVPEVRTMTQKQKDVSRREREREREGRGEGRDREEEGGQSGEGMRRTTKRHITARIYVGDGQEEKEGREER